MREKGSSCVLWDGIMAGVVCAGEKVDECPYP